MPSFCSKWEPVNVQMSHQCSLIISGVRQKQTVGKQIQRVYEWLKRGESGDRKPALDSDLYKLHSQKIT